MGQSERFTASCHFVRVLLQQAESKGISSQMLLDSAGLTPELVEGAQARLTTEKLAKIVQLMWSNLNDETMGFYPSPTKLGTFQMMGQLSINSPSLYKALKRATRFYSLVTDDYSFRLVRKGDECTFIYTPKDNEADKEHLIIEFTLIVWHRFASWLVGKHIPLSSTSFSYPSPAHVDEYKFMYPSPHKFNQDQNSFSFSSQYLNLPIIQNEESLHAFINRSPVDIFLKPRNDESFSTRIRLYIEPLVFDGFPDFDTVAEKLCMANQTLRRKLKAEGTSYQQIKDLVRRDIAIYHLTQQSLSISEISCLVGFTEPGAFIRAFKNWTGVTPGDYRKES
ncbi:AraC family transcriptional regulator [Neptunomonas japonica]|uniref:AraC family transcriptional regulator n=1 Tax=Neptunomonas japonica JAMM 1380 TaxID=1441457 RepID=A0A7R6PPZ6_9GAMM|nr:AraC family transcriptional regulator [Neptunomonas japonica]BBB30492.1 AraC family transcriptional regulator [Neptunomonas japonica JAMM 1380]